MDAYDVFEVFPNRSVRWRACVRGAKPALAELEAIAKLTANECFAINLSTQEIIARVNDGQRAADTRAEIGSAAS